MVGLRLKGWEGGWTCAANLSSGRGVIVAIDLTGIALTAIDLTA